MSRTLGLDSFKGLYERSVVFALEGVPLRVASIEDLIAMKSVGGRERDNAHIAELEAIRKIARSE